MRACTARITLPQLSGVIKHVVPEGRTLIGRAGARSGEAHIQLSGVSVQDRHALVIRKRADVTIEPATAAAQVLVNGKSISGTARLAHNDRVVLGPTHLYIFHGTPEQAAAAPRDLRIDYDFVQREVATARVRMRALRWWGDRGRGWAR